MNNEQYTKYNEGREKIIAKYRKKKLINSFLIMSAAVFAVTVIVLLKNILNIAITLVLSVMVIMIAIIFMRIRIVTLNHTAQTRLRFYEQNEPTFHVNFKK